MDPLPPFLTHLPLSFPLSFKSRVCLSVCLLYPPHSFFRGWVFLERVERTPTRTPTRTGTRRLTPRRRRRLSPSPADSRRREECTHVCVTKFCSGFIKVEENEAGVLKYSLEGNFGTSAEK